MPSGGGITLDISRLLTGLRFPQPTGIERIELGLAKRLSPGSGGIALTPVGACGFSATGRRDVAKAAHSHWESAASSVELELEPIRRFLKGNQLRPPAASRSTQLPWSLAWPLVRAVFTPASSAVDTGGVYLHANFFRLERPDHFAWLEKRPDIRPVFLLYDLLPIRHPHLFRPGEAALHARRIATASRLGRLLITSSQTVAGQLEDYLRSNGLPRPGIASVDLPVDEAFADRFEAGAELAETPYFVICGTIEPRKNHRLLLDVWSRLVEAGRDPPKLVIAGRRGWNNEDVFRQLDNLGTLDGLVLEAPALSTKALASLMRHARGVLSPSFDEGFGLPVAEALALKTPVIASDCEVYRELWAGQATLIDPSSPGLWAEAIIDATETYRPGGLNHGASHVMDWQAHVQRMETVLAAAS